MTKTQAVLTVVADGITKPQDVAAEVKRRFKIDVTPGQVSTIKFQDSKRGESGRPAPRKPSPKPQPVRAGIDDLLAVKGLVDRCGGIDRTREVLDALQQLQA